MEGVYLVYSVFLTFVLSVNYVFCALEHENIFIDDKSDDNNWNNYSPDDVRCYCNLPACVATGYMCRSEAGVCFSEVEDRAAPTSQRQDTIYKAKHGCLELLTNKNQISECRNMPNGKGASKNPKSLLVCCSKDMCNHVDSPETQTMLNGSYLGPIMSDSPPNQSPIYEPNISSPGYNSNEVWFKAAIIAVPICGTVILVVLIVLAVKILRTDGLSTSDKLGSQYSHGIDRESNPDHFDHQVHINLKKVPLLPHHEIVSTSYHHTNEELVKNTTVPLLLQNETGMSHCDRKNEANAKFNTAQGHEYNLINKDLSSHHTPISVLQKPLSVSSCNNVYKNVNLSVTHHNTPDILNQNSTEKLYDKRALSSVVNWGNTNSSCPV